MRVEENGGVPLFKLGADGGVSGLLVGSGDPSVSNRSRALSHHLRPSYFTHPSAHFSRINPLSNAVRFWIPGKDSCLEECGINSRPDSDCCTQQLRRYGHVSGRGSITANQLYPKYELINDRILSTKGK